MYLGTLALIVLRCLIDRSSSVGQNHFRSATILSYCDCRARFIASDFFTSLSWSHIDDSVDTAGYQLRVSCHAAWEEYWAAADQCCFGHGH